MRADKPKTSARRRQATKTARTQDRPQEPVVKPRPMADERSTGRVLRHRDGHTLH